MSSHAEVTDDPPLADGRLGQARRAGRTVLAGGHRINPPLDPDFVIGSDHACPRKTDPNHSRISAGAGSAPRGAGQFSAVDPGDDTTAAAFQQALTDQIVRDVPYG